MEENNKHKRLLALFWGGFLTALLIGSYEALMLLIQTLQSPVLAGILFYLVYLAFFMLVVFIINYIYINRFTKGKPLPGLFSLSFKHLTNEQVRAMGEKSLAYEIVVLRLDALIPSLIFFMMTLYYMLPAEVSTISYTQAFIEVGILIALYGVSYLVYVLILANLLSLKYKDKQFDLDDLQAMLTPSLLSGIDSSYVVGEKDEK